MPAPVWNEPYQLTTSVPAAFIAAAGLVTAPLVVVLTRNSPVSGLPAASYRRASSPGSGLAWLSQATVKLPAASTATAGDVWLAAVVTLTRTSAPSGLPAASRRRR